MTITDDDDTTAPVISNVSIPNTPMKVGDVVTATITVANDIDTLTLSVALSPGTTWPVSAK